MQHLEAGLWLQDIPKLNPYTDCSFSNTEFSTALRYRLMLPATRYRPHLRCNCANHPVLDPVCMHLATGCGLEGHRINTHNAVCKAISDMLRFMQIPHQREKRHCFRLADENCDKRPDFFIESSLRTKYSTVVADVSIVSALPGVASGEISVPSLSWAADKDSQLEQRSQEKTDKYADLAHRSKHGLQPLIFMSTGGIDEATRKWFLQVTRDQAPHLGIPSRILFVCSSADFCGVAQRDSKSNQLSFGRFTFFFQVSSSFLPLKWRSAVSSICSFVA